MGIRKAAAKLSRGSRTRCRVTGFDSQRSAKATAAALAAAAKTSGFVRKISPRNAPAKPDR
ncbi:MAG: SPOR domain-containing protein [Nitrospiraceae bacterium]